MSAGADTITFRPAGPLRGRVRVPGDKSITQRALLIGAVCDGAVEIVEPVWAGDPLATAGMVADLGVAIDGLASRGRRAVVHGAGLRGLRAPGHDLDAGNSGTGMRLLAGLLAGQRGSYVIDGDRYLRARPMGRIVAPLRAMGARIAAGDGDRAPLTIDGGLLRAIRHDSPVASAQVKSCVLLAGLLADGETVVREPSPSRDHTELMLEAAGAAVTRRGAEVSVHGAERLDLGRVTIPGDLSSAAFLVAAALLVPGSDLVVGDVGLNPTRLGFCETVRDMGGEIEWTVECHRRRRAARRASRTGLGAARHDGAGRRRGLADRRGDLARAARLLRRRRDGDRRRGRAARQGDRPPRGDRRDRARPGGCGRNER